MAEPESVVIISRTDYELGALGNLVATYDDGALAQASELHHEFVPTKSGYWIKDQLGSVRAVVRDGTVVEWNDYYAYGAVRDGATSSGDGRWKYLGKELDNETATQHLDAREYDPFVGIFNKPDRFEFLYPSYSPYVYGRNNPMRFHDATGDTMQEIVVTADRDPARQSTVTTVALPTSSPPFRGLGPLASLLALMWEIKQLSESMNGLIGPRLSPPQLMPADATGVYKPFLGQLQQPTIMTIGLSENDKRVIQHIADKYGVTITVVGSRAKGTANDLSDYDYVIEGGNSKARANAKRELPRGIAGGEISPSDKETGIDTHAPPVDFNEPHVTFKPKL